jgi:hypothetical protein
MTSIYRPPIASLTETKSAKSEAQLRADAARNEAEKSKRSKAEPINIALPRTLDWALKLPREVQPQELIRLFGRIANNLAANWSDPEVTVAYFSDLLVDTRGCRRGFPPQVVNELLTLQAYYALSGRIPMK